MLKRRACYIILFHLYARPGYFRFSHYADALVEASLLMGLIRTYYLKIIL